jgi:hypothetical protein
LSTIDLFLVISTVVSLLALAHQNLLLQPVKIASSQLLVQRWPLFAMQLVNQHSFTAVKEISESASQLLNVYLDFATLFQSVHH